MHGKLPRNPVSWSRASQFAIIAMAVVLVAAALQAIGEVAVPVFAALVVALTMGPAADRLGRWGIPPVASSLLLVVLLTLALVAASALLSAPIAYWIDQAPQIGHTLEQRLMFIIEPLQAAERFQKLIRSYFGDGEALSVEMASPPVGQTIVSSLSPAVGQMLVFFGTLLFMLIGREHLQRRVVMAFDARESRLKALRVVAGVQRDLGRYFAIVALINAGLGAISGVVFAIAGLPNPILWGTLAGALNFVPYIGPLVAAILLGIAGLFTFDSLLFASIPAGAFLVLNFVESQFVTPALLGKRLDTDPLFVFLAIVFGAWLWGPAGALLATPLLVIAISTYGAVAYRDESVLPG
jgi:predicted PurR-regulated permease PerM